MEEILDSTQPDIALYGRSVEEHGRYRIVVSGAALLQENMNKVQQYNDTYFPSCTYIGSAYVSLTKDSSLRLELTLQNTKVILDDFYIYYDQNEEMQNYLVEWNKAPLSPTEHDGYVRKKADDAARLGRIAQAYNREEAKVSFMWNVMNVLCLGFVVGVMAYGIISINNYSKMQSMQESIDYCMAFIEENTAFLLPGTESDADNTVAVIQQNVQKENEKAGGVRTDVEETDVNKTEKEEIPETADGGEPQTIPENPSETNVDELPRRQFRSSRMQRRQRTRYSSRTQCRQQTWGSSRTMDRHQYHSTMLCGAVIPSEPYAMTFTGTIPAWMKYADGTT